MRILRFALPLMLFAGVVVFLLVGLDRDPRLIPSPLIGQPVPAFELPTIEQTSTVMTATALQGAPYILNVWASWCVACRDEHPLLFDLAARSGTRLVGINYKDAAKDARAWLTRHGNPYAMSLFDNAGRLGLDLGVYGVPETFLVDRTGIIRYKHTGPITPDALAHDLLPRLAELAESP